MAGTINSTRIRKINDPLNGCQEYAGAGVFTTTATTVDIPTPFTHVLSARAWPCGNPAPEVTDILTFTNMAGTDWVSVADGIMHLQRPANGKSALAFEFAILGR